MRQDVGRMKIWFVGISLLVVRCDGRQVINVLKEASEVQNRNLLKASFDLE